MLQTTGPFGTWAYQHSCTMQINLSSPESFMAKSAHAKRSSSSAFEKEGERTAEKERAIQRKIDRSDKKKSGEKSEPVRCRRARASIPSRRCRTSI